jgi:hypothetical protein
LWHPTGSTAEVGQRLLDATAGRLAEALETEFGSTSAQ